MSGARRSKIVQQLCEEAQFRCASSVEGALMPQQARVQPMPPDPSARDTSATDWDRIAESPEFKDLMSTKKMFIIPAFVFFVVYYFALPVLVGYAPNFMATKVIGNINLAYLFALSQFFMAWIIAWLYVKAAGGFDKLAQDIIAKVEKAKGGN
jgi:uncharacterized membrane protein (DUF485 family)